MLNSKQRKNLRSMSINLEPIFQIGKGGITDTMVFEIKKALEARELIKISVLSNSDLTAKELIEELASKTKAQPVCVIGNKIILYKSSAKRGFVHLKF